MSALLLVLLLYNLPRFIENPARSLPLLLLLVIGLLLDAAAHFVLLHTKFTSIISQTIEKKQNKKAAGNPAAFALQKVASKSVSRVLYSIFIV